MSEGPEKGRGLGLEAMGNWVHAPCPAGSVKNWEPRTRRWDPRERTRRKP